MTPTISVPVINSSDASNNSVAGMYSLVNLELGPRYQPFLNYGYDGLAREVAVPPRTERDAELELHMNLYRHVTSMAPLCGKDVLEVGSGRGGGAYFLKHYLGAKEVVGLEYLAQSVALSTSTFGIEGLTFVQGDAEQLPFEPETQDVVVNIESSHCYPDVGRFFREVERVLRRGGYQLNWLTRGSGFFPMEYSKLGLEHFSPDYIEHFHQLPHPRRTELLAAQANWYKGISFGTIAEIYDCLYASTVDGPCNVVLQARSELEHVAPTDLGWALSCRHVELEEPFHLQTEAVVLGAGYQYNFPSCLEGLRHLLDFHSDGRVTVQRDYSLKTRLQGPGRIFIQNGEMHTHGVAAPDLGLGSHRNATIINALLGEQRYATSSKTVFQTFGIADCWQPVASS